MIPEIPQGDFFLEKLSFLVQIIKIIKKPKMISMSDFCAKKKKGIIDYNHNTCQAKFTITKPRTMLITQENY
jgi:hypothetical protein